MATHQKWNKIRNLCAPSGDGEDIPRFRCGTDYIVAGGFVNIVMYIFLSSRKLLHDGSCSEIVYKGSSFCHIYKNICCHIKRRLKKKKKNSKTIILTIILTFFSKCSNKYWEGGTDLLGLSFTHSKPPKAHWLRICSQHLIWILILIWTYLVFSPLYAFIFKVSWGTTERRQYSSALLPTRLHSARTRGPMELKGVCSTDLSGQ